MNTQVSRHHKEQLLQELEQLHSELASPATDPIPVLLEAVLDEDHNEPDLESQMSLVDDLLEDEDLLISDDMELDEELLLEGDLDIDSFEAKAQALAATPATKAAPELQLDLGYDLADSGNQEPLPSDAAANEALTRVRNDPLNYTGDDLFIDHQNREAHFNVPLSETDDGDEPPLLENPVSARVSATTPPATAPQEQFSSLRQTVTAITAAPPAAEEDENPFLPAHLREKLRQSKAVLLEEIQRSNESVNASSALLKAYTGDNLKARERVASPQSNVHQQMIDALVAQYLPIIEEELRRRLAASLNPTTSKS